MWVELITFPSEPGMEMPLIRVSLDVNWLSSLSITRPLFENEISSSSENPNAHQSSNIRRARIKSFRDLEVFLLSFSTLFWFPQHITFFVFDFSTQNRSYDVSNRTIFDTSSDFGSLFTLTEFAQLLSKEICVECQEKGRGNLLLFPTWSIVLRGVVMFNHRNGNIVDVSEEHSYRNLSG
jgi:hypothetical protein